jgi:hypothetical protein
MPHGTTRVAAVKSYHSRDPETMTAMKTTMVAKKRSG